MCAFLRTERKERGFLMQIPMKYNFFKKRSSASRRFSEVNIWLSKKLPTLALCSQIPCSSPHVEEVLRFQSSLTSLLPHLPPARPPPPAADCQLGKVPSSSPSGKGLTSSTPPNTISSRRWDSKTRNVKGEWHATQKAMLASKYLLLLLYSLAPVISQGIRSHNSNC